MTQREIITEVTTRLRLELNAGREYLPTWMDENITVLEELGKIQCASLNVELLRYVFEGYDHIADAKEMMEKYSEYITMLVSDNPMELYNFLYTCDELRPYLDELKEAY